MSIEDNKALARRYIEALHPQKTLAVLDELCVPDLVIHGSSGRIIQGLETYKQIQAASLQRFSDLQVTIEDQFAEGERSVLRYTERGTYTGPIKGIPQTGNRSTPNPAKTSVTKTCRIVCKTMRYTEE